MNTMNDLATIRKVAFWTGCAALPVAGWMAFCYGLSMSLPHAFFLVLLTFSGSFIFPYAGHLRDNNQKRALLYMLIGIAFLSGEYFTHLGYTVGTRVMNTEQTGVQNAAYKVNQDTLASETQNLAMWRDQLAKLKAQNEWATTVTADGLRAKIVPMDESIRQETARGGCGPKCLSLTEQKAAIEDQVAVAERVDDLTKRIDATQRVIDKKAKLANSTEFKTSAVVAQTDFIAQLATLQLEPGKAAQTWTQIAIGAILALVTTFLAPIAFSIAWGPADLARGFADRAKAYTPIPARYAAPQFTPAPPVSVPQVAARAPVAPPQPQQDPFHVHLHQMDANGLLAALQRKIAEGQIPRAAAA